MKYSTKFYNKHLETQFSKIDDSNWIKTFVRWMIDSKYRKTKRLDKFLKEQLDNPHPELVKLTRKLRKEEPDKDKLIIHILRYVTGLLTYQISGDGGTDYNPATNNGTIQESNEVMSGFKVKFIAPTETSIDSSTYNIPEFQDWGGFY